MLESASCDDEDDKDDKEDGDDYKCENEDEDELQMV